VKRYLAKREKKYIGSVKTRLEEHQWAIRLKQPLKSALAEHSNSGHAIDVSKTRVIAKVKNFKPQMIHKALKLKHAKT
jgi:hypothetical protein